MAAYDSIRAISLDTKGDEAITPILATPGEAFLAVTAHAQEGYMYYYEAFTRTVNRRFVNASGNSCDAIVLCMYTEYRLKMTVPVGKLCSKTIILFICKFKYELAACEDQWLSSELHWTLARSFWTMSNLFEHRPYLT